MEVNNAKPHAVFESKSVRDPFGKEIQSKLLTPGPQKYHLPSSIKVQHKPIQNQFFDSKEERFRSATTIANKIDTGFLNTPYQRMFSSHPQTLSIPSQSTPSLNTLSQYHSLNTTHSTPSLNTLTHHSHPSPRGLRSLNQRHRQKAITSGQKKTRFETIRLCIDGCVWFDRKKV